MTTKTTTSPSEPLPCPDCGKAPHVKYRHGLHEVYCDNYDGAPDTRGFHREVAWSFGSREAAVLSWNETVLEYLDEQEESRHVAG